jgi:hypothetical protein
MAESLAASRPDKLIYFAAAYVLLALGLAFNKGLYFSPVQLGFLVLSWLILIQPLLKKPWLRFNLNFKPVNLLLILNLFSFLLFYFFDDGMYFSSTRDYKNLFLVKFLALIIFLFYFVDFKFDRSELLADIFKYLNKNKFIFLILLAIMLRIMIVSYSPAPKIDVFYIFQGGSGAILNGLNPYSQNFQDVYSADECRAIFSDPNCHNDMFAYFPSNLLFFVPAYRFFGDYRYANIILVSLVALFIFYSNRKKGVDPMISELISLLILYAPLSLYVLEQGWVDQLSMALLLLSVFLFYYNKYFAYLVFGIFLASKQYFLIFLIFLFKNLFKDKKIIISLITFLLILLPFVLWNFKDFLYDTIVFQSLYPVSLHSLSLNTLYKLVINHDLPGFIYLPFISLILLFILLKQKEGFINSVYSGTLILYLLFIINRGFANYYYFVSLMIILLIIFEVSENASNKEVII